MPPIADGLSGYFESHLRRLRFLRALTVLGLVMLGVCWSLSSFVGETTAEADTLTASDDADVAPAAPDSPLPEASPQNMLARHRQARLDLDGAAATTAVKNAVKTDANTRNRAKRRDATIGQVQKAGDAGDDAAQAMPKKATDANTAKRRRRPATTTVAALPIPLETIELLEPAPPPRRTPVNASPRLTLINPAHTRVVLTVVVNGRPIVLPSGTSQEFPAEHHGWLVQFHRGGDFGDASLYLTGGAHALEGTPLVLCHS